MIPCVGSQSFLAQWLFQLPPRTVLRTTCSRASRSPCVRPIYISGLWGNMVCSFHLPTVLWWSGLGKRWSILDGFIFDITISLFVEYVVYDYMLNQTWYVLTVGGDSYFFPWIFQFSNVQIIWRPIFCTSWGVKNMNMILECQEAYSYLATKCYRAGVKLFRLRPKIHFQCHLTMNMALGSSGFSVLSFLNANSVCMETYFQFVFQFWFSCTTTAPLN